MYRVGAFVRAVVLGAITSSVCVSAASADIEIDDEKTVLYFYGANLWRHGLFLHGGLLWSPDGLDRDGFALKYLIGGGQYRYVSGALGNADVTGQQAVGFLLPGWRFQRERLSVSIFGGLDVQEHQLLPDDPSSSLRGRRIGVRAGFELWFEPTVLSMISGDASISSIGPSYSARLALGWRVPESFYIGPEIGGFSSGDNYNQFRAGLHITGLQVNDFEWSAALGWAFDNDERNSLYGRLSLTFRR